MRLARPAALLALVVAMLTVLPTSAEGGSVRYYESTGHTVSGAFLAFLAERGDTDLLGAPLTEAIVQNDVVVQWFEGGALQLNADLTGSLMPLPAGVRPGPFAAQSAPASPTPGVEFFPATGMYVAFGILDFYQLHGGAETFGQPISPQLGDQQWFERARLDWDPQTQQVTLAPLGADWMRASGLNPLDHQTQWVATFEETPFLADPSPESSGPTVGQFRPFLQVGGQGDYLKVWDPARNRYGWLSIGVVGPGDMPTWLSGLEDAEIVGMPGRIAKPIFGQYVDPAPELAHNQAAWIAARITAEDGSAYYLDDSGTAIAESIVRLPTPPAQYHSGKWIDADLREPVLVTAYEDDRPVYSAMAVKGMAGTPTRIGSFQILRRVANETMSSATIGVPLGSPGSYYVTGVLFTQYFTSDGAALHYNYWRANWGYAGSHGCLGMNYDDSEWFWNWATVGTPVITRG